MEIKRFLLKVRNRGMDKRFILFVVLTAQVIIMYAQKDHLPAFIHKHMIKRTVMNIAAPPVTMNTTVLRAKRTPASTRVPQPPPTGVELTKEKPWCPEHPKVTAENASFPIDLNETSYAQLVKKYGHLMQHGGHYIPPTCRSREHVALIIPYRDRQRNLHILLNNLLPFLMRQQIEFTVFLAEQTSNFTFNKGLVFNVAYKESKKIANFTCIIMQDTDLIPMDNRNFYRCADQPRHLVLTTGQTSWKNRLRYKTSFGGSIALRKKHFEDANGFSVSYYGWGFEDDDLYIRLKKKGYDVVRYPILIGKYYEMRHSRQSINTNVQKMKRTLHQRIRSEGLNHMNFTLVRNEKKELYTWILVQVPPPPVSIYGKPAVKMVDQKAKKGARKTTKKPVKSH